MKVREIITIKGWQDGSGWSYDQCTSDDIIDIGDNIPESIEWDWWELPEARDESEDVKITVEYFAADATPV